MCLVIVLGLALVGVALALAAWTLCVAASRADDGMEAFWLARERARR
jgi:hypothetical protein